MAILNGSSSLGTKVLFSTVKENFCGDTAQMKSQDMHTVKSQLLSIANPQSKGVDANTLKVPIPSLILTL